MSDEDDDALGFATLAPAFLLHKAKASLEDDEALGLAKLCAGVDARHVSDAQSRPAFLLAGNVLRHLDARDRRLERERAAARERERAEHARELEAVLSEADKENAAAKANDDGSLVAPAALDARARSLEDANAALASDLADARAEADALRASLETVATAHDEETSKETSKETSLRFATRCAAAVDEALGANLELERVLRLETARRKRAEAALAEVRRTLAVRRAVAELLRTGVASGRGSSDGALVAEIQAAAAAIQRRARGMIARRRFREMCAEIIAEDARGA